MTNVCRKFTEYKKTRFTFRIQCVLIVLFAVFCGGSLIMSLLHFPPLYGIVSLNMSLMALGTLLGIIIRNHRFVTYTQYRNSRKKFFECMERMLDNQETSDDEILIIVDHRKLNDNIK